MNAFIDLHQDEIGAVSSRFDRVVISSTLPDICHARAMAGYLGRRGIRLLEHARWPSRFACNVLVRPWLAGAGV